MSGLCPYSDEEGWHAFLTMSSPYSSSGAAPYILLESIERVSARIVTPQQDVNYEFAFWRFTGFADAC
jgi:hypothetical protein